MLHPDNVGNDSARSYQRRLQTFEYDRSNMAHALDRVCHVPRSLAGRSVEEFMGVAAYREARATLRAMEEMIDFDSANIRFPKAGVWISGTPRTGKSSFAAALAANYVVKGVSVRWLDYATFVNAEVTARRLNYSDPEYAETYGRLMEDMTFVNDVVEVLIVDDIEQSPPPQFMADEIRNQLHLLLRRRVHNGHFTIITSNLTPESINRIFSDRLLPVLLGEYEAVALGEDAIF